MIPQGAGKSMEEPVVTAAQLAFSVRLKGSSDVSENTKNAQAIAKAWRGAVHKPDPDRFQLFTNLFATPITRFS